MQFSLITISFTATPTRGEARYASREYHILNCLATSRRGIGGLILAVSGVFGDC